jgi:hypothetical protein
MPTTIAKAPIAARKRMQASGRLFATPQLKSAAQLGNNGPR